MVNTLVKRTPATRLRGQDLNLRPLGYQPYDCRLKRLGRSPAWLLPGDNERSSVSMNLAQPGSLELCHDRPGRCPEPRDNEASSPQVTGSDRARLAVTGQLLTSTDMAAAVVLGLLRLPHPDLSRYVSCANPCTNRFLTYGFFRSTNARAAHASPCWSSRHRRPTHQGAAESRGPGRNNHSARTNTCLGGRLHLGSDQPVPSSDGIPGSPRPTVIDPSSPPVLARIWHGRTAHASPVRQRTGPIATPPRASRPVP
jgi:hypothetical protein